MELKINKLDLNFHDDNYEYLWFITGAGLMVSGCTIIISFLVFDNFLWFMGWLGFLYFTFYLIQLGRLYYFKEKGVL